MKSRLTVRRAAQCKKLPAYWRGLQAFKYRLYEIDLIINRALVYGSLTVMLAASYAGVVISLQYVLRAATGQESTLAVVASTLAIAALFGPLRRRVQTFVDRRFYRRKYDAVRARAGAQLRRVIGGEVNRDQKRV